jgi:TatD DNase family protein
MKMQKTGRIAAVCVSSKKGIAKTETERAFLIKEHGIEGDAHAGAHHRQVSLLAFEKAEDFRRKGADVRHGSFGENFVVEGLDLATLPIKTTMQVGTAVLQLTQIGKECHHGCAIFQTMGDCIMPREGVFARVLQSGTAQKGDAVILLKTGE